MATVVNMFKDTRAEDLGRSIGESSAKFLGARKHKDAEDELAEMFANPDATSNQVAQKARATGMKPADSLRLGQEKERQNQKTRDEQAMLDLTNRLSGGDTAYDAFTGTLRDNPGISSGLLGTLSSSPVAQDNLDEIEVYNPDGASAKINVPSGVTGDSLAQLIAGHTINKGGAGFTRVDPNKPLDRAAKAKAAATPSKPSQSDVRKAEIVQAMLKDVGAENTGLHRGRAMGFEERRAQQERALDDDFGKPPEQSFTEWDAPQTTRHALAISKEYLQEMTILEGAKNPRLKAAAAAKEDVSNGKFLERVGVDVDKALPKTMIKKLKVMQFSKEEAADIMQNRAKIDGASKSDIAAMLEDIEKIYGVE